MTGVYYSAISDTTCLHLTPKHKRNAVESLPDWEAGEKDGRKTVAK
jgi:hypothetical protein